MVGEESLTRSLCLPRRSRARHTTFSRDDDEEKEDGGLVVHLFASVEEDVTSSWPANMNSAWGREERRNLCEIADFKASQVSTLGDDSQNIVRCIACFSIMGLALPILWNLVFGYGFSLACQAKGQSKETCEELSIDFVLAMELPIIFISAVQTMNRCVKRDGNPCESAKSSLESEKDKPLLLL